MEANKIAYGAKSIVLDNGAELTYCELGEQNEEVLVTGAFYFHTVMPVVEFLAERYHVYGVVMRFDGATDELNPDGSTNWTRQWGADVYRFAKALGLEKFRYFGKCHGTIPGWYLVKEHPEMLTAFARAGIPTIKDIPDNFNLIHHCTPRSNNPFGSAGCSETYQSGGHMAVINAIDNACGVRIHEIPAYPEKIKAGLEALAAGKPNPNDPGRYDFGTSFMEEMEYIRNHPMEDIFDDMFPDEDAEPIIPVLTD